MTEHTFEVATVQRLGEQIGYGHLMSLASALWRRELASKYGDGYQSGAFVPTLSSLVKDEWADNLCKEMKLYDAIVEETLGGIKNA